MELHIHPGVLKVAEFMQRNLPADELRGVAAALAAVAPSLWAQHAAQEVRPLSLSEPALKPPARDSRQQ